MRINDDCDGHGINNNNNNADDDDGHDNSDDDYEEDEEVDSMNIIGCKDHLVCLVHKGRQDVFVFLVDF